MPELPSLLFHPHPRANEGPHGYLLRLATENHLLLHDIRRLNIHFDAEILYRHGLMPDQRLEPELFARIRRISTLLASEKRAWNHRFARFCPHCLAEEAYWHADWELYFQDACPEHGVWLIDHCSSCQQPLSWNRKSMVRCECGADLRTEVATQCPDDVVRMAGLLRARLFNLPEDKPPLPLKALNLGQVQQLIRFLGAGTTHNEGRHPLKVPDAGAMERSWGITSAAAAILMDWPTRFHQVLDQLQARVPDGQRHALKSAFGWIYQYLFRGLKGSAFDVIRDEFQEWVTTRWQGGVAKRNRRLAETMMKRAVWIPAKIARDELGISQPRLESLIRDGLLESESFISDSGRKFCMVRRDQLLLAKEKLEGGMDMLAASQMLGFSKKRMRSILKLLFPNASKHSELPGGVWFVPRSDVEAVLHLAEGLPALSVPDEGCVSIDHILRYREWSGLDIVGAIQAAMAGDLTPLARIDSAKGVASLVFEEAALKRWFELNARGVGQWLTCPQFAVEYSISQEAAYELVSRDFIKAERLPNMKRGGWRISRKAIEQFFREYVFATELASQTGMMSIVVRKRLAERGILPVSGPGVDGAKKLLYRRTPELEQFVLESIQPQDFRLTPTESRSREVGKSEKSVRPDDGSTLGG